MTFSRILGKKGFLMSGPGKKKATYDDLLSIPDNMTGEISFSRLDVRNAFARHGKDGQERKNARVRPIRRPAPLAQ
jgi:hypothetical protein